MITLNSKILVIGLGSMGQRRIRCLQALGHNNIVGFDTYEARKQGAKDKYGIKISSSALMDSFDAVLVCTPPDQHSEYLIEAKRKGKPCFVEASVIESETAKVINELGDNNLIYPSCTFLFHPLIKKLSKFIANGEYGKVTNFSYHSGQYLPDWHPWESIFDFYVSKKQTGGAREIVPFELTWIIPLFGKPNFAAGAFARSGILEGCEIDDTYSFILSYPDKTASITVDVVSRVALRELRVNFEKALFSWNWSDGFAQLRLPDGSVNEISTGEFLAQEGYDPNIGEQMYIDEINTFISSSNSSRNLYPNTLGKDLDVLKILTKIEN